MSVQNIMQPMERLVALHMELLELTQRKKQILIDNQVDELTKLVNQEGKLVRLVTETEKEWKEAASHFMLEKGYQITHAITLTNLIQAVNRMEDKLVLRAVQEKLASLLIELKQANDLNQQLLEQSLAFVNYNLDMMTGYPEVLGTYQRPEATPQTGKRRGIFDTKA